MRCELDHLVVACKDLDQGAAWVVDRLGIEPQPGGKHTLMGTHNRLLRLGPGSFFELMAMRTRHKRSKRGAANCSSCRLHIRCRRAWYRCSARCAYRDPWI